MLVKDTCLKEQTTERIVEMLASTLSYYSLTVICTCAVVCLLFRFDLCLEEGRSKPVETSANKFVFFNVDLWITENVNVECQQITFTDFSGVCYTDVSAIVLQERSLL